MFKILLVGPIMPPIHGQSMAFTRFTNSIKNEQVIVINTNLEEKSKIVKIFSTLKTMFYISIKTLFFKYDVVYFTCSRSFLGSIKDVLLINLVSMRNVKIVNHLHGSDFYEFLHNSSSWYKKILLKSYNKVDTSIVLVDKMKFQFQDFEHMNVEVVANFYDAELNVKLCEKEKNKINIVYLSNIVKSKGILELIDAFEELSKKYDNIYLNIAGEYISDEFMSKKDIEDKFNSKISLCNRINYIGKTFGTQKVKLLQSSDIFVLPSYYKSEAFPISIIEAMACENAIVTTNYKYLPEVVKSNNGILVEPKSVSSLVSGIESLLKNTSKLRELQKYNYQEAKGKYSFDRYSENLNRIVLGKS